MSFFTFSFQHALPLPGFVLLAPNIYHHAVLFSQSGECCIDGALFLYLSVLWKMLDEAFVIHGQEKRSLSLHLLVALASLAPSWPTLCVPTADTFFLK